MTQSPTSVIPANAGTHGFARLLNHTTTNRTPSMGPGVRRDDGNRWGPANTRTPQQSPEPSR